MSFGQVLEEVMAQTNQSQSDIARIGYVTNSTVSKIVRGSRRPSKDLMFRAVLHFADPRVSIAAQEEVSDGSCAPWLDGADLHKSTVHLKSEEEISEAIAALRAVPITKRKDQLSEADMKNIKLAIMECIEVITALTHYVAILCKEYGFSWIGVWKEHRSEMKMKNYLRGE
jgi:transcriptional regulator with XRE-family HTH domain